eukprot:3148021-Pyramimonas_sp.AAC.1
MEEISVSAVMYEATAPDPSKQFVVRFKRVAGLSAHRAGKPLGSLRGAGGVWKVFQVPAHAGGGEVRLHIMRQEPGRKAKLAIQEVLFGFWTEKFLRQRPWMAVSWLRRLVQDCPEA